MNLIQKANKVFLKNFKAETWFERAIFLSWYCSKGDCNFCYMSIQKPRIKNPKLARRRIEGILKEAEMCKKQGWKIEFLSGGYDSYTIKELVEITKKVYEATGQKQWLNIGVLSKTEMKKFKPYIEGVVGAVESINEKVRKEACPSKPLEEIKKMLIEADKLGLKKGITIIIGLGETEKDIEKLHKFIKKYKIDRVTFYRLNPHKGTIYKKGPESEYYTKWIAKTRIKFPKIEIIAGSWVNKLDEIDLLLRAGANAITKFPAIKLFGTKYAKKIEEKAKLAGRRFRGSLTHSYF
ncbi:MAG: radical SAM protein [Candidatus Nanoarchaeia archaeon]